MTNCERAPGCRTCGRPPVGAVVAEALADLGAGGATKDIARFLKHAHPQARILAAGALGKLKATAFVDDLAPLLDDADVRVQVASADTLAQLGAKAHTARIARLLRAPDAWARSHALDALAALQAQDQVGEIRALLKDERPSVRGKAARVLGRLGRKECADEIATILTLESKDPHDDFFSIVPAVEALRTLEAKGTARALKRVALDKSERLGRFTVPHEATPENPWRQITLAELIDEILRDWGIDPKSLKD